MSILDRLKRKPGKPLRKIPAPDSDPVERIHADPPWSRLPVHEQEEACRRWLRQFLSTQEGEWFLALFLRDHYYFEEAKTQEEQALRNYATFFIRERLGVTSSVAYVRALLDNTVEGA